MINGGLVVWKVFPPEAEKVASLGSRGGVHSLLVAAGIFTKQKIYLETID